MCYDHLSLLTTLPTMLSSWHFLNQNCWQKHGVTFNILTNIFILKLIWQTFIIYNLEEQLILSMSNFDSFMLWHIGHKIRQTPCQVSGLAGNENIGLLDWDLSTLLRFKVFNNNQWMKFLQFFLYTSPILHIHIFRELLVKKVGLN